jgi:hypothetical protein
MSEAASVRLAHPSDSPSAKTKRYPMFTSGKQSGRVVAKKKGAGPICRNGPEGALHEWDPSPFSLPGLLLLSSGYLVLPYLIFFFGWLKWPFAVPAAALVLASSYHAVRSLWRPACGRRPEGESAGVTWRPLVLLLAVALLLSFLSGAGGYGAQDSDHPKHNAVLKALVEQPWPVVLQSEKGFFPLVYYTAYYLPAGLFGKVAGWEGANHCLQFWTLLGLVLSLSWFCVLCRRLSWVVIGVFVFFSGLDVVGAALFKFLSFTGRPDFAWSSLHPSTIDWASLRWWNWEWQLRWWDTALLRNYPSNMALLFFVPQQALAGWILTGIVAHLSSWNHASARRTLVFYWALSCLWAPFVTIGLLPLLLFGFLRGEGTAVRRLASCLSPCNLCGLGICGLTGLYYLTRFAPLPFEGNPATGFGIGHPHMAPWLFLLRWALFVALEVGILAWLVWNSGSLDDRRSKRLFLVVLAFLVILPLFRYGGVNDLVMRASIPCLFVFAALVARSLLRKETTRTTRLILIAVFAVAAANPVAEIYRHVRAVQAQGGLIRIPKLEKVDTLWGLNLKSRRSDHPLFQSFRKDTFFLQYVGSPDSLFFRLLARAPAPQRSRREALLTDRLEVRKHNLRDRRGRFSPRSMIPNP